MVCSLLLSVTSLTGVSDSRSVTAREKEIAADERDSDGEVNECLSLNFPTMTINS